MRITNRDARHKVQNKIEFIANNIYAQWHDKNTYCVYSYGNHWILYMYKNEQWFECNEKRSVTTSKHSSQTDPLENTVKINQRELQYLKDNN